ncbi:adenosine receptor A1-like [Oculina patagonica]
MDFTYWNIFWTVTFGLTAIVVTAGNLVTIGIFLKRNLRERPHFLLISLAIADMLVGAVSVPLYIAIGIHPNKLLLILSFQCVDIFTGVISIFTLASISLERMHAIVWPLRHRTLTSRFYTCAIGIPWIVGLLGILARVLLHFYIISTLTFFVIVNTSLSTPLVFTSVAYVVIWRKQKCRFSNQPQAAGRDRKLAKTLFLITGAFIVTWFPFHIINIIIFFCFPCQTWPYAMFHTLKLLQFSNSFINVIIYPLRISEYKEILLEKIYSCICFQSRNGRSPEQSTTKSSSGFKTRSYNLVHV